MFHVTVPPFSRATRVGFGPFRWPVESFQRLIQPVPRETPETQTPWVAPARSSFRRQLRRIEREWQRFVAVVSCPTSRVAVNRGALSAVNQPVFSSCRINFLSECNAAIRVRLLTTPTLDDSRGPITMVHT